MTLTQDEMLATWRLLNGYEPLRNDAAVTRTDGIDLDSLLRLEMEAWYCNALATAPIEMLEPKNIAFQVSYTLSSDRSVTIPLPGNIVRIIGVKLDCWAHQARLLYPSTDDTEIEWQSSPYSRAGDCAPVAVVGHDELRLYSVPEDVVSPVITHLNVIARPDDGSYIFNPSLLNTIRR